LDAESLALLEEEEEEEEEEEDDELYGLNESS
jgi:hypothetical protein